MISNVATSSLLIGFLTNTAPESSPTRAGSSFKMQDNVFIVVYQLSVSGQH